ncbi:zinc-binding alcohol dehydrogenase family protein [Sporomusa sp.]|uniref:zinc-binding alcohol dehydrogenase family protein n=1 Tax=Sporomusa sp. TaxID=2078658 RepID=UPI002D010517|nr:zinc-binding alcohol dehydrogenase family protein [Sporomusa sp.]HWR44481.1 zinc-binding alcohol dehydrogenase family protein [Sporomusa sp.]
MQMKAVNLNEPNSVYVQDVPIAVKKDDSEVLIKVKALGICGSDIGAYKGTNPLVTYPRIIGHEIGGEVLEVAENDRGIKVGDKVIVEPYIPCYKCYPCSIGRTNCCVDLKVLGVHVDGGMTEYFSHPLNLVSKVPENMEWKHVAMIEPLTIALHSIHRPRVIAGEHVLLIGAGPIGLLAAQVANVYGATPIVMDLVDERLELAKTLGVKHTINITKENAVETIRKITNGRMVEVVVEASGAKAAIQSVIDYVSFAGRIALVGWPNSEIPLPTAMITKKELNIVGSRTSVGEFKEATELIYDKKINVDPLISKVVTLDEVPSVLQQIAEHPDKFMKVVAVL